MFSFLFGQKFQNTKKDNAVQLQQFEDFNLCPEDEGSFRVARANRLSDIIISYGNNRNNDMLKRIISDKFIKIQEKQELLSKKNKLLSELSSAPNENQLKYIKSI